MMEMLRHDFLQHALAAGVVSGVALSFVGVYVILRRIVFFGAALAQLGAVGVGLALLIGQPPLLIASGSVLLGVLGFAILPPQERQISRESLLGAGYALASALALLFIALSPVGEAHMTALLFGDLLALRHGDAERLAVACLFVLIVHFVSYRAFVAVAVDPTFAHSIGIKERLTNLLFYLTLGVLVGACIHAIGALVVFAFLVLPPIAGLLWAKRLQGVFAIAIGVAIVSVWLGLWLSYHYGLSADPSVHYGLPAGPSVVAVCGSITGLAALGRFVFNLLGWKV